MKEMRNILGWLGMAEELSILQDSQKHVEETYKTVTYFAEAVDAFIKADPVRKAEQIENVRQSEHRADALRSKMVSELSEGMLLPPDREDLMHFVKTLDRIADWTNGSARLLDFIKEKVSQPITKELSAAADIILSSASKLKDGIHSVMENNLDRAIADCNEVGILETRADDQKKTLIELIVNTKMEAPMLLLLYQLAEYMESVTDKIEDAADFIKVLAIKSK